LTALVYGFRELSTAYARIGGDTAKAFRTDLRQIAEPVRQDAEVLAAGKIPNVGVDWPRMRTGVGRSVVYVAPKMKGVRGRGPRSRPNFANLLMERAMAPALDANESKIVRDVDRLVSRVGVAEGF
jgi:hypothetical protein